MGGALWFGERELAAWTWVGSTVWSQATAVGVLVAGAMLVYFALALATGAVDRALVRRLLRRGRRPA